MWVKKFSKVYPGLQRTDIWRAWADVNNWFKWDSELEYCDMNADFIPGAEFTLKPRNGPKVKITLLEVVTYEKFTDYCKFLGATMYDAHELKEEPEGLRITNTVSIRGPLSLIWANLVGKKVAKSVPAQTDSLVAFVRQSHG